MSVLVKIATLVSALGALNWGLKPFTGSDLVAMLSAAIGIQYLDMALYLFVAACGLISLLNFFNVM